MSRHDDQVRLGHMLDHACEAVEMAGGKSRVDLDVDRMRSLALVRLIEIVGEAANKVSKERRAGLPEIRWGEIIGMRNRIVHGYDDVDLDILWAVIRDDLPRLIQELKQALGRP